MNNKRISFLMKTFHVHKPEAIEHWIGEKEEAPIIPLKLVSYGDGDWLSLMQVGDRFLAKEKADYGFKADEYSILGKLYGCSHLREEKRINNSDASEDYWVINIEFCNKNKKVVDI